MATRYTPAKEVEDIARDLMRKHHPHLLNVDVRYVFRSKATKRCGNVVLGKAKMLTGLNAWLATGGETDDREVPLAFFLIEIAYDTWEELGPSQQIALVDHELCHCVVDFADDGEMRLGLRGHDVEDFMAVLERHGPWRPDLAEFVRTANQLSLLERPSPEPELGDAPQEVRDESPGAQELEGTVPSAAAGIAPSNQSPILVESRPIERQETAMPAAESEQPANGERVVTVADLTDVDRIAPEPIPAEARSGGPAKDGPRVVHFDPDDIPGAPERAGTVERTPLRSSAGRDPALAKFLAE